LLEDFPAIHTKGGPIQQGSSRLFVNVDLSDTPSTIDLAESDIEAQTLKVEEAAESDETLSVASPAARDY
jgi:hypothetical protein